MILAEATVPFGLLGVLIVVGGLIWLARSRSSTGPNRECPHCKKRLRGDASVCPHCQRESEPWTLKDGVWWRRDEAGEWEYRKPTGDGGARWVKPSPAATREP